MATRNRQVVLERLQTQIQEDLQEFAQENGPLPDRRLVIVLDAYLRWNGIIGYTAQILSIVEATE